MPSPEHSPEPMFANVSELLFSVAKRYKELHDEARRKLHEEDIDGYKQAMRESTQLIVDLPEALTSYRQEGGVVPQEAEHFAKSYSAFANQMLVEGSVLGMGTLLIPKGSRIGDPDDLERLAAQLQPPAEATPDL